MLARQAARPFVQAVRSGHHAHGPPAPVKFTGPQTPTGFVHDGWANARMPFNVRNKWLFATKATIFLALGFWAPFAVVEWQLRKANAH
ncbi:unnamed protein product, partial [Mesorhabditis belari]|uniref:Cytochrome c oxidase polypeptide VIIc n=1 Tax=Mesorhabditis belari TaxID=2138241 RepID=A0AAF3J784_9BILA